MHRLLATAAAASLLSVGAPAISTEDQAVLETTEHATALAGIPAVHPAHAVEIGGASAAENAVHKPSPSWPQSKAILGILCLLGDAAVDVEVNNCEEIGVPEGYEDFCGRWQCSDPHVDHCYFTDQHRLTWQKLDHPADHNFGQSSSQDDHKLKSHQEGSKLLRDAIHEVDAVIEGIKANSSVALGGLSAMVANGSSTLDFSPNSELSIGSASTDAAGPDASEGTSDETPRLLQPKNEQEANDGASNSGIIFAPSERARQGILATSTGSTPLVNNTVAAGDGGAVVNASSDTDPLMPELSSGSSDAESAAAPNVSKDASNVAPEPMQPGEETFVEDGADSTDVVLSRLERVRQGIVATFVSASTPVVNNTIDDGVSTMAANASSNLGPPGSAVSSASPDAEESSLNAERSEAEVAGPQAMEEPVVGEGANNSEVILSPLERVRQGIVATFTGTTPLVNNTVVDDASGMVANASSNLHALALDLSSGISDSKESNANAKPQEPTEEPVAEEGASNSDVILSPLERMRQGIVATFKSSTPLANNTVVDNAVSDMVANSSSSQDSLVSELLSASSDDEETISGVKDSEADSAMPRATDEVGTIERIKEALETAKKASVEDAKIAEGEEKMTKELAIDNENGSDSILSQMERVGLAPPECLGCDALQFFHQQKGPRWHWRPMSLAPCKVPSQAELFGKKELACSASWHPIDDDLEKYPTCSLYEWERATWKQFFADQAQAQDMEKRQHVEKLGRISMAKRRLETCHPIEPFLSCDAHNGAFLDTVWRRFGMPLIAKLRDHAEVNTSAPAATSAHGGPVNATSTVMKWQHCANSGELCLCTGDVRFGAGGQWAEAVLTVRHGIQSCSAEHFDGSAKLPVGITHVCECNSRHVHGPLIVPSIETVLVSENCTRTNDSKHEGDIMQPRFIRGSPYPEDIRKGVRFDYASVGAGSRVVTTAKGIRRASAVLAGDDSDYLRSVCEDRAWFVISLLDDLFLEHIGLVTLEFFASGFRHLQILGSSKYPTDQWRLLGEIETSPTATHEIFDVGSRCRHQSDGCWIRFLKVRVLSHHKLEDNTYCALTRFQAFGSTQIAYIAEEKTAEDAASRQPNPTVVNILDWHDKATHGALASLMREEDVSIEHKPYPLFEERRNQEESQNHEEVAVGTEGQSLIAPRDALAQKVQDIFKKTHGSNFGSLLARFSSWLINGSLPRPAVGNAGPEGETVDPGEDTANSDGGKPISDVKGEPGDVVLERPEASIVEKARMSLSEVFAKLNASGTLTDGDLDGFDKLRFALGSLNGSDLAAAAASSFGSAVPITAPPPSPAAPRPAKTSSSTPALVRINNDLRDVQLNQESLQKNFKSVAFGMSTVLIEVVKALENRSTPVRAIEAPQEPFREAPSFSNTSNTSCPASLEDDSRLSFFYRLPRTCFITCSSFLTIDRCLLLMLFVWNLCLRRSGTSVDHCTIAMPSDVSTVPEGVYAKPSNSNKQLNEFTVSGASGNRLLRELRVRMGKSIAGESIAGKSSTGAQRPQGRVEMSKSRRNQQQMQRATNDPALQPLVTDVSSAETEVEAARAAYFPRSPASSSDSGEEQSSAMNNGWGRIFGLDNRRNSRDRDGCAHSPDLLRNPGEQSGTGSGGGQPPGGLSNRQSSSGGQRRERKRHSSAARRHVAPCMKSTVGR